MESSRHYSSSNELLLSAVCTYVAAILPKLASEPRTENDLKKIKSPYMVALMLVRKCKVC